MKLTWDIKEDGWTSERSLVLFNDRGLLIWRSAWHLHEIDQITLRKDLNFLRQSYGLSEDVLSSIEEIKTVGRVT